MLKKYLIFNWLLNGCNFFYKRVVKPKALILSVGVQKGLAILAMGKHNNLNNTHSASDLSVPVWVFYD